MSEAGADFRTVIGSEHGRTRIAVQGVIDERSDLEAVAAAEGTLIEIDLGGVGGNSTACACG
jgi:hypothetical protein